MRLLLDPDDFDRENPSLGRLFKTSLNKQKGSQKGRETGTVEGLTNWPSGLDIQQTWGGNFVYEHFTFPLKEDCWCAWP